MRISIVTTCKSRLHHLKQVIDSWLTFEAYEIVVVDVKSPDGLGSWLASNHPNIRVCVLDRDVFNLAEARNVGAEYATGEYLFFVDADITLERGLHDWFSTHMLSDRYAVRFRESAEDGINEQGTILVSKDNFRRVGGYDEVYAGYGGEDHDFLDKLTRARCQKIEFPKSYIRGITHSDTERTQNYLTKDKKVSATTNRVYRYVKQIYLSMTPEIFELPLQTRRDIWGEINLKLGNDFNEMTGKTVSFTGVVNRWLPPPNYLEQEISIRLSVKPRGQRGTDQ